ncbi:hypothetical protein O6H91_12G104000 [Diphasiastrum complanatum]|uniref:Uncharacterized protein n=1 Tax=Diphasiastrum complanatum TaxID=34168 RepID=A0ACC2C5J4_DIPCM|nr:hypothetical protein O6H91_12G104000 [Diphasiastrum complanatum]
MVKRSKKSKSKRVPLRKKYKILKKVKEHHKKKAKEAKKLGKRKAKVEKDPGIPNAWPFKEQELQALEARRARALKEIEDKKQARKERAQKRKLGLIDEDDDGLTHLSADATARDIEFAERNANSAVLATNESVQDGSYKAFYRELLKVIEASDVVIQVLDARDPLGTRCPDLERLVLKSGVNKRVILLLNKIDLVPKEIAEKWLSYLREELPTVAFKCSTQKQKSNLGRKSARAREVVDSTQTSDSLGAEILLRLLKNYSRNQQLKTAITVGVVGFPNVGKSSLINSLKRARAVSTGATPGVTRVVQEIQLDKHVKLLDSPGIVFSNSKGQGTIASLRNCVRIEKLEDPTVSGWKVEQKLQEILQLCRPEKLMSLYKITHFSSVDDFLQNVALVRGKLKKGGLVDKIAAARVVLHDWNEGKIPHYSLPPIREASQCSEAAIVADWGKEFVVDEVYKDEQSAVIAGLSSLLDGSHTEIPSGAPMTLDMETSLVSEGEQFGNVEAEEAEPEEMDINETRVNRVRADGLSQNEKLYDADGILNPRLARAEKKRRKKATKSDQTYLNTGLQGTYDFSVDYQDTDAQHTDDPHENEKVEPMIGVEH